MAAHTPGPWEWNQDNRWPRCLMAPRGATGPLSMVRVATILYVNETDATLIAAAPDLRRFAQEIAALGHWEAYTAEENLELLKALQRQARQLVAKADGAT